MLAATSWHAVVWGVFKGWRPYQSTVLGGFGGVLERSLANGVTKDRKILL
jgi:hypothetical protein